MACQPDHVDVAGIVDELQLGDGGRGRDLDRHPGQPVQAKGPRQLHGQLEPHRRHRMARLEVVAGQLVISVVAILFMCLGNLRGIREAGRIFALPTYLFAVSVIAMIVAGVVRELSATCRTSRPGLARSPSDRIQG